MAKCGAEESGTMKTVTGLHQGFAWWGFARNVEPVILAEAAAKIGYASVDFAPENLYPLLQDNGLRISAAGGHKSLEDGLNKRENHARIEDELRASLEKATQWDIPNLICFTGNRNHLSDGEGAEITAECLRKVAPAAEAAGVNLSIELLNSRRDHPDYQNDHTAFGVKVCELVGSPRVNLLYDIYHMQIMEGDIIATLRANIAHISHFHTAGNPGRRDLDDAQELYYPPIVRAIVETGFNGYLCHEFSPKGDPIAALEAAFKTCSL